MTDAFGTPAVTPAVNSLESLVGEGKKFADVEALAKGKVAADAHIARLEEEAVRLREVAQQNINAETQLTELKNELMSLRESASGKPRVPTEPALTETDIETLVERSLTKKEANRTVAQNINESNNRIVRHFGTVEKAQEAVRAKADEMGVTVEFIKETAARSPTAFMQLMGIVPKPASDKGDGTFIQSSGSVVRPEVVGSGPVEGSKAWLDTIRRKEPNRFFDVAFQQKYIWGPARAGKSPYATQT